jgi:hypothetical protein
MSRSRAAQAPSRELAPMMVRPATPPPAVRALPAPAAQGNAVRAQ